MVALILYNRIQFYELNCRPYGHFASFVGASISRPFYP